MLEYCKGTIDSITDKVASLAEEVTALKHNGSSNSTNSSNSTSTHAKTADSATTLTGLTASVSELNYVDGVTSNIQTQLDNKAGIIHTHNAAGSSLGFVKSGGGVTISNGIIEINSHDHEITNINGLQSVLDNKSDIGHTHNYAESSTPGGSAISADKLNIDAGDDSTPVYFRDGIPVPVTSVKVNVSGNAETASHADKADEAITLTGMTTTVTELNYVDGVTSSIQDQLNDKEALGAADKALAQANEYTNTQISSHTHSAAGTEFGFVKSGGDITISNGVITLNTHNHTIDNITGLQYILDNKEAFGAAAQALADANDYTDKEIATLIGTAPEIRDTLGELNDAIKDNADVIAVLQETAASKADSDHIHNYAGSSIPGGAATSADKLNIDAGDVGTPVYFKDGIPVECTSIRVDVVGNVETAAYADNAGEADTLTGLTSSITELNYTDGVTGPIQTQLDSKETAGAADQALAQANEYTNTQISSHTHNYAVSNTAGGAATSADKLNTDAGDDSTPVYFKDGIPVPITNIKVNVSGNAETATHASKSDEAVTLTGMTTTVTELNYLSGTTSNIQDQLDSKEPVGAASQALVDANVYTDTQISNHTHNYAGSSSIGGAADSANKLNTDAGDASTPVYFQNGIPIPVTNISVNVSKAYKADEAITLSGMNTSVTELNYIQGTTSNIQEQLNNKLDSNNISIATDEQILALFA